MEKKQFDYCNAIKVVKIGNKTEPRIKKVSKWINTVTPSRLVVFFLANMADHLFNRRTFSLPKTLLLLLQLGEPNFLPDKYKIAQKSTKHGYNELCTIMSNELRVQKPLCTSSDPGIHHWPV